MTTIGSTANADVASFRKDLMELITKLWEKHKNDILSFGDKQLAEAVWGFSNDGTLTAKQEILKNLITPAVQRLLLSIDGQYHGNVIFEYCLRNLIIVKLAYLRDMSLANRALGAPIYVYGTNNNQISH